MTNIHTFRDECNPAEANGDLQSDNLPAKRTRPIFGGRTILAMGNRPQDHRDRDLLLASLIRDRRLRMFRKQCRTMPAWAPAVPKSIPANFQYRAQQLIMLGCMHQHLIEKMRGSINLAANRPKAEQMLRALEACPPRGALFTRATLDSGRPCGYAKSCPWCHARSVQGLYRHLLAGSCTPERLAGRQLVSIRTRVDAGEELQACEVRKVRDDYRYELRALGRKIGVEGGVIIHQVTPWISCYGRACEKRKIFAHVFTMIGVAATSVETLDKTIDEASWGVYETAMLPADPPDALRYLLFGSSYKFDSSELGIVVNDAKTLLYGIQGAAALEPWFLFDEQQAWSYAAAVEGVPLYDRFGNWCESQAGCQRCSRKRRAKSEDGSERRRWAFQNENCERHREANDDAASSWLWRCRTTRSSGMPAASVLAVQPFARF
jgi:hypothetical protein